MRLQRHRKAGDWANVPLEHPAKIEIFEHSGGVAVLHTGNFNIALSAYDMEKLCAAWLNMKGPKTDARGPR